MATYKNSPPIVTNGLVLSLDAANTKSYPKSGNTWSDLSGNRNNGTLTNGPIFSSDSGGGIAFDGVNDYAIISNSTSINPTAAVTFSAFFNFSSFSANFGCVIYKQNNYASFNEQYLIYASNTDLGITLTGADRSQKIANSAVDYRNKNTYVVGTCDTITDELKLYINGVLIQTVPFTSTFDIANTPLQIGGTGVLDFENIYQGWLNGKIYSAHVYNRALSASEILQNYNAQKSRFGL